MHDLSLGVLTFAEAAHIAVDATQVSPGLRAVVTSLSTVGATREELRDQVWHLDGEAGLAPLYYLLRQWAAAGLLCHTLVSAGAPLVTWVPLAPGVPCGVTPLVPETSYVLSRFAYSRRDGAQLVVESPLCAVQLRLHDGRGAQLLSRLSTPQTVQSLHDDAVSLGAETVAHFTGLLHHVGMLSQVMADTTTLDDTTLSLATWEFHDLLFHSRSRVGRHANPVGAVSSVPLAGALSALDITVGADGTLDVVVTDDYLHPELEALNRRALEARRPWMLLKPVGLELWLGPIFRPHETGCWVCLAQRLRDNRPVETWLKGRDEGATPLPTLSRAALASSLQSAIYLAATAIAQWLATGEHPTLVGQVLTVNAATLETRPHRLVRRPQCAACGEPAASAEAPSSLVLTSRPKGFTADGGHRHVAPAETLARYEHHVSAITGVVPDLWRPPDTGDEIAPVYIAPNVWRPARSLAGVRSGLRQGNSGKGKTEQQARVSGLCEALERYSGVFQGHEPRQTAHYEALGEAAIHPADCLLFSAAQYRDREAWNASSSGYNHVPAPFDAEQAIEWTPVWSLRQQRVRYVPTAWCYYGYPLPEAHRFCRADSNGNAGGNTLEEAILQGFLEVVERDSVALWWYNRVQRPGVDLRSFDEPYFRAFTAYYAQRGREVWVLDLTSDLSIPVFVAVSRVRDGAGDKLIFGLGAHVEARIGIERALTEMTQSLSYFAQVEESEPADAADDADRREALAWWQTATLAEQSYLAPSPELSVKTAADYPRLWSDDLREDVEWCVSLAAQHGLETLVLDQTRPDIGLSVVKVIVPGMRHFWRRLAPGRLYDVPVELGWLPAPLSEAQLNPLSIFL